MDDDDRETNPEGLDLLCQHAERLDPEGLELVHKLARNWPGYSERERRMITDLLVVLCRKPPTT